jgi:hypothetical protein
LIKVLAQLVAYAATVRLEATVELEIKDNMLIGQAGLEVEEPQVHLFVIP